MKRYYGWGMILWISLLLVAHGQVSSEDQYVRIYGLIQEADSLNEKGDVGPAVTKYLAAQTSLNSLRAASPEWNERIVKYRLNYIAAKLEPLLQKSPALASTFALTAPSIPTNQIKALSEEISRLTAQNVLIEAKLKEALSVQPAALDPREVAKAQEKTKQIEKERDLLRVALEQEKAKSRQETDPAILEEERKLVTQLKAKLADQAIALDQMQKQNQTLQQQVAELKARSTAPPLPASLSENEAFGALETSNKMLRTELILLESRLADWVRQSAVAARPVDKEAREQPIAAETALKALERERDELRKELNAALSQPGKRNNPPAGKSAADLKKQLDQARARIEVLEAKPAPYTSEELALFKQPAVKLAATATATPAPAPAAAPAAPTSASPTNASSSVPGSPKKKGNEIPAGAGPLVAEAQRAIESGDFDVAEKKYLDVLRQDENNVYVLANLAAVQLDQNHTDAAEKTLARALANDPEDSAALYLMGSLKFRQDKLDDALDALSLSARINPDKAQTQYFLGQVLIQKGNRGAAEAALRKAIQLKPGWGDAHYLLAVMYSAQTPPFRELAEWHYKRAISGGAPRNLEFEQWMQKQSSARR